MRALKLSVLVLLVYLLVIPCILTNPCMAQDPPSVTKLVEYIGTLEKANGSPYPQGIYDINFEIFLDADCTNSTGWSESHTVEISAKNKKDIDGATSYEAAFSVILGSINTMDLVFDQDLFLRVTESTLGHENVEQFTSTASALTSEFAVKVYDSDIQSYTEVQKVKIDKAKDADTVDGKHYSDIAAEVDADVAAHAVLTTTHGVIGEIVGTTDTQTLTNKSISGEQINSGKISNDRLNMGNGNGLDADTVDGAQASELEESGEIDNDIAAHTAIPDAHHPPIPAGVIVMWSGSIANIPDGWHLCDGTDGTPDLRDRFIVGASPSDNPGATGGASSYSLTVSQLPLHTHTGGTTSSEGFHSHSGSTSSAGSHSHSVSTQCATLHADYDDRCAALIHPSWGWPDTTSDTSFDTSSVGNHGHSFSTNAAGSHAHSFTTAATGSGSSIDNRPAYYALAFIMKM